MLIDTATLASNPADVEAAAIAAEADGYDGFGVAETKHDAFVSLALAARATTSITLQSAIAVAFARNPMSMAVLANDIQLLAEGRFQLGIGSQVKPHIERRFSMQWSHPAARMEEFIAAMRAIWNSWASGERLAVRGQFYQHTLMTDFFDPGPNPYGNPPLFLAAVGERMTAVAGRVADGILCHSFTTEAYLRERTLPALLSARGSLAGFTVCLPVFAAIADDATTMTTAQTAVRAQIAFYGSTPAYRPVLDLHGWGDLHERLNVLSRRHEWAEMGNLISDEVLDAFAVSGTSAQVADAVLQRFGDVVDRVSLYTPRPPDHAALMAVNAALRAGSNGEVTSF